MTLAVLKRHDLYIVVRGEGAARSNKKNKEEEEKKEQNKKQRRGEAEREGGGGGGEGGGTVASFALHSHNDNVTIRCNYSASSCG